MDYWEWVRRFERCIELHLAHLFSRQSRTRSRINLLISTISTHVRQWFDFLVPFSIRREWQCHWSVWSVERAFRVDRWSFDYWYEYDWLSIGSGVHRQRSSSCLLVDAWIRYSKEYLATFAWRPSCRSELFPRRIHAWERHRWNREYRCYSWSPLERSLTGRFSALVHWYSEQAVWQLFD